MVALLFVIGDYEDFGNWRRKRSALAFTFFLVMAGQAAMQFGIWEAMASTDEDADGLTYGIEFMINTQPQDWDSDNDGLPDGWEWQYGLDPLSSLGDNGSTGDADSDALTNLNEYLFGIPSGWDEPSTSNVLDNGVWWNGTVPTRDWDEESAMQIIQGSGSDGFDEDPVGNICTDTFDNDHDGMVDLDDPDNDGDADCDSDDDDGDGLIDEDPNGWDTDGDGMPDGWEAANGLDPTSNSNQDGTYGDPDGDGLPNIYEYVNPAWGTRNGSTFPPTQYFRPGPINMTATESPCNPMLSLGPGGCQIFTAEVDGITQTDPQNNDTDGDELNDSFEALVLLTDPTAPDTDSDGISDGVEFNGSYGFPEQGSNPRDNNTDGDWLDDGEEDLNGNGVVDEGETDPTRIDDDGDFDGDGLQNWEENMSCTFWNVSDSDGGGINDGDEASFQALHLTDPCTSMVEMELIIVEWDLEESVLTLNSTLELNPNPVDWRQSGAPMAYYQSSDGFRTPFRFDSIFFDSLRGVDTPLPSNASMVVFTNGSWCYNGSAGAINDPFCDDDYFDTDGDGLADWEERLGTWGFISYIDLIDSDGDGVDDLSEIQNQTDPLEPCDNFLDTDEDGLNDFFEYSAGCPMQFGILGSNLTFDTWITLPDSADSDNGGVDDGQEYIDGTNPQNNPDDDLNPTDSDGDGIPDSIENETGTDWRDPDSDGGGIPDGEECAHEFWPGACVGSLLDPFDPLDDLMENSLMFSATNTTGGMDPSIIHYWRWHTYDSYTGVSWGVNTSLVGFTQIDPDGWSTTQGLTDQTYWNGTSPVSWEITFDIAGYIGPGQELIQPYNSQNFTSWADFSAGLNFSNYTRDVIVDGSTIEALYVTAPEVIFTSEVKDNSTAFTGSTYATDLPRWYLGQHSSLAENVTQSVLNQSGALSAWDKVLAIQDFLTNGNETISFLRNHNGSKMADGLGSDSDITHWILNSTHEGSCDEFTTVFAVMLRLAGIPTRKVTGFSGGSWDGRSFNVFGKDFSRWVEVHLQTNENQGELDLGWIPFEACPPMSLVQVIDETWGPSLILRNTSASGEIWLEGRLNFVDNGTAVDNLSISLFLVSPEDASDIPGRSASSSNLVASGITTENGTFNLTGLPPQVIRPGYGSLVIQTTEEEYVGVQGISFPWQINVTDDVAFSILEPPPIEQPMLGIGVNSTISGQLSWASEPFLDPTLVDSLEVVLNYSSQVDGEVNITSQVSSGGYYEFIVPIDELEPLGLINASISFLGWHSDDLNNATPPSYHARPNSLPLMLNITLSPNLSVNLESQGLNNSILEVDNQIFINGTVLSRGDSPTTLNGTLILEMRRSDIAGPYTQLNSWYLNNSSWLSPSGDFAISWGFDADEVPLPAGPVDVRFQFDADDLFANDQEQFSDEFGIRSYVEFNYTLHPEPRGVEARVDVFLTDHTGSSFASFDGLFNLDFDEESVWSETDPSTGRLAVSWTPELDMVAGDYSWILNYSGSTWLQSESVEDSVRIQGLANVTATLNTEWTPRGTTNWVSGLARDMSLNTAVIGNNSSVTINLEVDTNLPPLPNGFPAPPDIRTLATGWIDPITGGYNLSFQMPSGVTSGVYEMRLELDFTENPQPGGNYYTTVSDGTVISGGIQTEFVVSSEPSAVILVAGEELIVNSTVTDVEDSSTTIQDVDLDLYFDWGGPQQQLLDSTTTNSAGLGLFSPTIPSSVSPGFYEIRIHAPDDLNDNLSTPNAGRWLGNESLVNLTVQVPSQISITSIPSQVTALQYFTIEGTVLDLADSNRTIQGPVGIDVFFLDEPDEILLHNHTTNSNGSFNVSVPTDTLGNGVQKGVRTVVVSIVDGSTPFYLTGTGDAPILVVGVPIFVDSTPFLNTVINRGESLTITTRLVEFSDNEDGLSGYTVMAKFHDTWLDSETTSGDGSVAFDFVIPDDHPLGLVNTTFFFNGSPDLHPTIQVLSVITVRSPAIMAIDPITDNPIAGDFFNVTGSLVSGNGSALTDRLGNPINPTFTFSIDGETDTFTVSQIILESDGDWTAQLRLDLSFPRGSHGISVVFTPEVIYYTSATDLASFDSRGYSLLAIVTPADLDPDNRTQRGEMFDVGLSLVDNSGNPVSSAALTINIDGSVVWGGLTNPNGEVTASILAEPDRSPGPMLVTANFSGINGSTGLLGDEAWTRVVILAPTEIGITEVTSPSVAGQTVTFSGTLLDERGKVLHEDGVPQGGVIHLFIDGMDVGPLYTAISNATNGNWSITYDLPSDMDFGSHQFTVSFLGGFTWVDPMGQGDSLNPEYFLGSSNSTGFNVTQTSQVIISTPPGEVDRTETLHVQGLLTDGVGRPLGDRGVDVLINGDHLTGLSILPDGTFSAYIPISPDMNLGPMLIEFNYPGELFVLPSNSTVVFTVFGPVYTFIEDLPSAAVGDTLVISGLAKDNLDQGWLGNHTIEVFSDGILVGITSTGDDGQWSLNWVIPETVEIGNHTLTAIAPAQGFHREGSYEVTFTVAYHTSISVEVEDATATRGGQWNFSGRLFEADTGYDLGLDERELTVLLDGSPIGHITTETGGLFSFSHGIGYSISRGMHNVSFSFAGEHLFLSTESNVDTLAFSEIVIEVQPVNSKIIRGNVSHSIMLQGVVRELGGDSSIFENLTISLYWGDTNLPLSIGPWNNPNTLNFQIKAKAQEFLPPGKNTVTILVEPDQSRFLNGGSKDVEITVLIEVDFTFSSIELSEGQRVIRGTVNATAVDTGEPVEGLSLTAILLNGTTSHFSVSKLTNEDGVFEYEFKSLSPLPPLSDTSSWGKLSIMVGSSSDLIDARSLAKLPTGGILVAYEDESSSSIISTAAYGLAASLVAAIAIALGIVIVNRRKKAAIKELAGIFNQTAEMLASGDEFRKAIFECYERLCSVLMRRGFLRRNFETVREFEVAIRDAIPIREESLMALDRIFEEARYSSHVLGGSHRENAQLALSSVLQEIEELEDIPKRNIPLQNSED